MNLRVDFRIHSFCLIVALAANLFFVSGAVMAQQPVQVLHGTVRPEVSSGRVELKGAMPAEQMLKLSILLPLRNQAGLSNLLGQLYDPASLNYRHWLSVSEFTEQYGPTVSDYQAVVDFARAKGLTVTDRAPNRLLVPVTGSVAQVERAFHVSMRLYQHPLEKRAFYSADREPTLDLPVPVEKIVGLDNYNVPRPMVVKGVNEKPTPLVIPPAVGSGPGGVWGTSSYLASDMRAAYYGSGTSPVTGQPLTGKGQAIGLMEFAGYDIGDVTASFIPAATATANGNNFVLSYTPPTGGKTYLVPINNVLLNGITSPAANGQDDAEPALDIVSVIGMAPGLSQVRVYYGNSDVDIYNSMATENICKQLSISWVVGYYDSIFQEYAAQGQSIFAASGDNGNPPISPAESAWVTAVGGTHLLTNGPGGSWNSEYGWNASGAGPSPDNILIPSYQANLSGANGASTTLRNVPDVVMEGANPNYGCDLGACAVEGGTSYSAPRYAAFIAMANEQAVAAGNSTLGFINPAIYALAENASSYADDFHDITTGNSNCCGQASWYLAGTGYDLVTGWGSPTGQNLIDALTLIVAKPNFAPAGGTYAAIQSVVISDTTTGANIYYTTDGSTPTAASTHYTGPISVANSATLTAIAVATGFANSGIASESYVINVSSDFSLVVSPTLFSLTTGQSGTGTVSVTAQGGFVGVIGFACTGLPTGASCSFSPASITPTAFGAQNTTVTVTAPMKLSSNQGERRPALPGGPSGVVLAALALGLIGWKKGRPVLLMLMLGVFVACGLNGCGGAARPKPITAVVQLTATSGALTHSVPFTLNVQ